MGKKITMHAAPPVNKDLKDQFVEKGTFGKEKSIMKRLTIEVPELMHKRLKVHCANKGEAMTDLLQRLIEKALAEEENKQ